VVRQAGQQPEAPERVKMKWAEALEERRTAWWERAAEEVSLVPEWEGDAAVEVETGCLTSMTGMCDNGRGEEVGVRRRLQCSVSVWN
jgi:hypothetical protein